MTPDPDQVKAAAEAYVYGYPLVYNLDGDRQAPRRVGTARRRRAQHVRPRA